MMAITLRFVSVTTGTASRRPRKRFSNHFSPPSLRDPDRLGIIDELRHRCAGTQRANSCGFRARTIRRVYNHHSRDSEEIKVCESHSRFWWSTTNRISNCSYGSGSAKIRDGEFEFEFALNGQEASLKLNDDPALDIVMSDINMPVMDGLTLLSGSPTLTGY